jgi:hypothetical protein
MKIFSLFLGGLIFLLLFYVYITGSRMDFEHRYRRTFYWYHWFVMVPLGAFLTLIALVGSK